jgi:hypothetical protein
MYYPTSVSAEASTEEGEVIRDGAAIINHYEQRCGNENKPNSPKQKIDKKIGRHDNRES